MDSLILNEIHKLKELLCNQIATRKTAVLSQKEKTMLQIKDCSFRVKPNGVYEYRYRKNGYNKSFSSKDPKKARADAQKFLSELKHKLRPTKSTTQQYTFGFWADKFFDVQKRRCTNNTLRITTSYYKNHVKPYFENRDVRSITSYELQQRIDDILSDGKGRTAEEVFGILSRIFEYCVQNEIRNRNPMALVYKEKHERQHGKRLEFCDEKHFVSIIQKSKYKIPLLLMLYTGLRPCEIPTVRIDVERGFVIAQNSKRKSGKMEYKEIPITPMFSPYVTAAIEYNFTSVSESELSKYFHKLMPNYKLYDLRHTFNSTAHQCGIPEEIRNLWLGHGNSSINTKVYLHPSDEHQKDLAKRINYDYASPQLVPKNTLKQAV